MIICQYCSRNPDFLSATSASGCETSGFKSYCPVPRRRRKPFSRTTMEVITRSLGHHQPHPSKAINVFTHWVHPDQLKRDPHSRTVSLRSESDTQAYMISNMAPQHEASYEEQGQCGMGDDVNELGGLLSTNEGTLIIRYLRSSTGSTTLMKLQMIIQVPTIN